ncbi:MAG: 2-amino-4-hydroxy-6-hydroxymethyldihydropteridine diphosphokinase [Dehalococcoidia bacterium]|nr:2-amino-4-hydroxy-6-hydroxymethyldihydropteridine diphosphokinase [Dehalococcoidia bacterium]
MTPQGGAAPPVEVYLGLGGNLGDRRANLAKAVALLSLNVDVARVSGLYETEPVGYAEQPRFLNAVALVRTTLPPRQLFSFVKGIERAMGREPSFRNAPRLVDIDILLYGDAAMQSPYLTVPHPRMHERAFVLAPLAEIAPEAWHPALLKTVRELLADVSGREGVRLVEGGAWWKG